MPRDYPDYPDHRQIAAYFDAYADHFGIRERIRFETRVEHAERLQDGTWELTLDGGASERFDVAVRRQRPPLEPALARARVPRLGHVRGRADACPRVHVAGLPDRTRASSCWAWATARWTSPSRPRTSPTASCSPRAAAPGSCPKYLFGKPTDQFRNDPRIPFKIRQKVMQRIMKTTIGSPEKFGLPKPDHEFGEAHPTVSGRILDRITHGAVHAEAEHRAARRRPRRLRRRHAACRPTSSSTAPATRSRSRSSTRSSSRRRTTTSSCTGASSIRTSRTCSSSACCSRSAP